MSNNKEDESGTEQDVTHQKSLAMQEESMGPLREDLADWIAKTLGINISKLMSENLCRNTCSSEVSENIREMHMYAACLWYILSTALVNVK